MKRYSAKALLVLTVVLLAAPVGAGESQDMVLGSHYGFSGVIAKIESGMLFIRTDASLQPRVISPNKADRVGLYDAKVGDTVNLAARLQSAGQPGKGLVSDSTARLVQAAFELQPLGQITVKGTDQQLC